MTPGARRAALGMLLCLALTCVAPRRLQAQAQGDVTDPRNVEDPRDTARDPRDRGDPRRSDEAAQRATQTELLEGSALYDLLLERDDRVGLARTIQEDPWDLLSVLDGLCEQWLALRESGALATLSGSEQADVLRAHIETLAQLGDQGLRDTAFSSWVSQVFRWNDEQIAAYREAQALYVRALTLYGEAPNNQRTLQVLTPLRQAMELLRPLGTTWESSMTLALMGRVQMANRQWDAAQETMSDALRLGRSIRDLDSVWLGLSVLYEAAIAEADYDGAMELLKQQYRITLETGDESVAKQVVKRLTKLDAFRETTGF